jgi:hypothetical protein
MGDTFLIKEAVFCGYAVEDSICYWGAVAFGQGIAPEGKVGGLSVPLFRHQPEDCLQMEDTLYPWWASSLARSLSATAPDASPTGWQVDQPDPAVAQGATALGAQENSGALSAAGLGAAQRTNHCPMVQAVGADTATATAAAQSLCAKASVPDRGAPAQSGLDGRFQGMVSRGQRGALRAVDGARPPQSLRVGCADAGHPAGRARQSRLYRALSTAGNAGGHPDRQRESFRIERPGRAFAFERLVAAVGDQCGVYPSGLSARQRCPRAVSWSDETGNRQASRPDAKGAAASDNDMVVALQSSAPARGAGTNGSGKVVPQEPAEVSQAPGTTQIWPGLSGATGSQQRRDPMVRSQAVYWRGIRGSESGTSLHPPGSSRGVFYQIARRAPARTGYGSHASGTLQAPSPQKQKVRSVTYVLSSKCHPCVVTVHSPALSLRRRSEAMAGQARRGRTCRPAWLNRTSRLHMPSFWHDLNTVSVALIMGICLAATLARIVT